MAQISCKPKTVLELELTFTVDESEARALDALAAYGDDAFIKAFYENLGKACMKDHEEGLRKFLKSIRGVVVEGIEKINRAREALR